MSVAADQNLNLRRCANAMQHRWCTMLLARAPTWRTRIRADLERSRAWLEHNPTRTLHADFRERFLRYDASFDAEGHTDRPLRPLAKPVPRQLSLPLASGERR